MLQLAAFLPYRLSVTANVVSRMIARTYEGLFGLKIPEWRVIAVLGEAGGLTQAELCQRTEMDKMTISRACAALTSRRLTAREVDDSDGRAKRVTLTNDGRLLYDRIAPEALRLEAELIEGLTTEERSILGTLLDRLHARARSMDSCND